MKAVALLLGSFMILGAAAGAVAQSATTQQPNPSVSSPSAPSQAPGASATDHSTATTDRPAATNGSTSVDKRPDVNVNVDKRSDARNDDGSALPRSAAGERTTIFGLSPTAAVVIAAALLVVVILAIVAMTRSGETTTYVDRDRRL